MPDKGLPISYEMLERNVPVYASDGEQVGAVEQVLAASDLDIFHGIVMRAGRRRISVAADQVAALHERGVDLRIDAAAVAALATAGAGDTRGDAGEQRTWQQIVDKLFPR